MVDKLKVLVGVGKDVYDMDNLPPHTLFCDCNKRSCRTVKVETFHTNIKKMDDDDTIKAVRQSIEGRL